MSHCTDAFSQGLNHTIRLLFQPFRLMFWLRVALLSLLIQGISLFNPLESLTTLSATDNYDLMAEQALEMLPMLLGLFVASLLLGIITEAFRAWSRIIVFDAVRDGQIYYRASTSRHFSGIVSLFLWNIGIKIAFFFFFIISLAILFIPNWFLLTMTSNRIGLVLAITLDALYGLFVFGLIFAHTILLNGIVVPNMAIKAKGIWDSWIHAFQWVMNKPGEMAGYALIRFIIATVATFLVFILVMIYGVFAFGFTAAVQGSSMELGETMFFNSMQLPLQIMITMLFLPIFVLKRAYALCFMSGMENDNEYMPKGPSSPVPGPETEVNPMQENETGPIEGPVSFKDIPMDCSNTIPEIPASPPGSPQPPDQEEQDFPPPPPASSI